MTDLPALETHDVADPLAAAGDGSRGAGLISAIAGERASQGAGNKIASLHGRTHVVWQDSHAGRYFARVRSLDHATGAWSPSVTLAEGVDEHARPTLAADSAGHLHVVMGGHNSPLQYRRSVEPGDSSAWTPIERFGASTYPVLVCGPDDTLHLTARPATHEGVELWRKPPGGEWTDQGLIVRRQERFAGYTAMHNDLAWGPGQRTLHMSVSFFLGQEPAPGESPRDPQGRYQAIGYMASDDGGRTWRRADGGRIELPATSDTLDSIDAGEQDWPKPGINHGGIAVDAHDRPYLGYVRHTPEPGQARLLTRDPGGRWIDLPLAEAIAAHWPGLIGHGVKPVIDGDGRLCVLLTLAPRDHPAADWSPGVHGRPAFWLRDHPELLRIAWLESVDGGRAFRPREIVPDDPERGQEMPSIERSNGPHGLPAGRRPTLIYTLGLSRYARAGETIDNELYWVRPEDGADWPGPLSDQAPAKRD